MQKPELVFQCCILCICKVWNANCKTQALRGKHGMYFSRCKDDNGCFYFTLLGRHLSKAEVLWEFMESEWDGCISLFG